MLDWFIMCGLHFLWSWKQKSNIVPPGKQSDVRAQQETLVSVVFDVFNVWFDPLFGDTIFIAVF